MKYNVGNLYFAKCRHCIMDVFNVMDENGIVSPHPDYVDYYTILLLKKGNYVDVFNKKVKYIDVSQVNNPEEYYDLGIILELYPLSEYVNIEKNRVSTNECLLMETNIKNEKSLKMKYGYKGM